MLDPTFQQKLPEVTRLLKEHKVKRAYAFGSIVNGKFNSESDIDLLISFEEGLDPLVRGEHWWELYFGLQDLFKREIDLVTEEQLRNPYLIESIDENKSLIYGKGT
ncbi:MAG TPA: nucleotidyltransferase domain-containing protein [Bacteroidia bacterium]|nr:nucleotidyltransferase domain-containing protein [Bacteroidia bacterium]